MSTWQNQDRNLERSPVKRGGFGVYINALLRWAGMDDRFRLDDAALSPIIRLGDDTLSSTLLAEESVFCKLEIDIRRIGVLLT